MNKPFFAAVVVCALFATMHTHAAEVVDTCVYPKGEAETIQVSATSNMANAKNNVVQYAPYQIVARDGNKVAIWTVQESVDDIAVFVGWVKKSDFVLQAPRNCD